MTHNELISYDGFNTSFKNALRDYYVYGYKGYNDIIETKKGQGNKKKGKVDSIALRARNQIDADWRRLNNIMDEYWKIDKDKNEGYFYLTSSSQDVSGNPFHNVYRFCSYCELEPDKFFNAVFALSNRMDLRKIKGNNNEEEPWHTALCLRGIKEYRDDIFRELWKKADRKKSKRLRKKLKRTLRMKLKDFLNLVLLLSGEHFFMHAWKKF